MVKFRAWIEELGRYADGVDVFHDGSWSAEIETLVLKGTPRECMGTEGGYGEKEGDALEQFAHASSVDCRELFAGDIIRYQASYFSEFSKPEVDFISAITFQQGEGACVINPSSNKQINIALDRKTMTWGNFHYLGNIHQRNLMDRKSMAQYIVDEFCDSGGTASSVSFPDMGVLTAVIHFTNGTAQKVTGKFAADLKHADLLKGES